MVIFAAVENVRSRVSHMRYALLCIEQMHNGS